MTRLSISEREVVLVLADTESVWTVYSDSRRLTRRLLAIAARWDVRSERWGEGYQLALPVAAVRFVGPPSQRRRQASRESLQKARSASKSALRKDAAEESQGQAEGEDIPSQSRAAYKAYTL